MDDLRHIIRRILGASPSLKQGLNEAQVLELWPKAVGPQIANHAKAIKLRDKTILISVDHPVWKQELMANRMLVLKKLNETLAESLGGSNEHGDRIQDIFIVNPSKVGRAYPKK
jgi:predicted nucleic acid-binding Zn ribbon protein